MKKFSLKSLIPLLAGLLVAALPVTVDAQSYATWQGTTGADWTTTNTALWNPADVPVSGSSGYYATFNGAAGTTTNITIASTGVTAAGLAFGTTNTYTFSGGTLTLDDGYTGANTAHIIFGIGLSQNVIFDNMVVLNDSAATSVIAYDFGDPNLVDFAGGLTLGNNVGLNNGGMNGGNYNNQTIDFGGPFINNNTGQIFYSFNGADTGNTINWKATSYTAADTAASSLVIVTPQTGSVDNLYTDPTSGVEFGSGSGVGGTINLATNGLTVNSIIVTGTKGSTTGTNDFQTLEVNTGSAGMATWAGTTFTLPTGAAGTYTNTYQFEATTNDALTVSSAIGGGSASLQVQKTGAGTVVFSGANNFTAASTTVTAGTLVVQSSGNVLGTSNVVVDSGAALDFSASSAANSLAIGGTLTVAGGTGTTLGGSIGSTTTNAEINVTGAATVSGSSLSVNIYGITGGNGLTGATPATGTYTLITGGSGSALNGATSTTIGNVYNASDFTVGTLTATSNAITVGITSNTNTPSNEYWVGGYSGGSNVWSIGNGTGTSNWSTSSTTNAATSLTPGPGTVLHFNGTGNGEINGATQTSLGSNMSINSIVVSDPAGLGLVGDGFTLYLAYTGGITVNSGAGAVSLGSTISLQGAETWTNSSTNSLTITGLVFLHGNVLTLAGAGGTTFEGELSNPNLTVTNGAGAVNIQGPVIFPGNGGSNTFTNNSTNTLTLSGSQVELASYGVANGSTLTIAGTGNTTISDPISGVNAGSAIIQGGTGILILSGANTYAGGTEINSGTLAINNASALGSGVLEINGGFLDNSSSAAITLASNNTQQWNASFGFIGTQSLNLGTGAVTLGTSPTVTVSNNTLTEGGVIGGSSYGLTKAGAGTLVLTGANTFNGGTTINDGVLAIASTSNSGSAQPLGEGTNVIFTGASSSAPGVLQYTGGTATLGQRLTVSTGDYGFVDNSGGGTLTLSGGISKSGSVFGLAGGKFVVSGVISGTSNGSDLDIGSTSYGGAATVALATTNSYNGPTYINDGSYLLTTTNNALPTPTNSVVTLGAASDSGVTNTLDLAGTSETVASLNVGSTSNNVVNQVISSFSTGSGTNLSISTSNSATTGTLTVDYTNTGTNDTFSGSLGASGSATNFGLVKSGAGTLILTGTNTYTGGTTIEAGVLGINSGVALGATNSTVTFDGVSSSSNAILDYNSNTSGTLTQNITVTSNDYGLIENGGTGVLDLSGSINKNGSVLTLSGGKFVVSGVISGSNSGSDLDLGSTSYGGAAMVALTTNNTYNGPTVITGGSYLLTTTSNALPTSPASNVTLGASTDSNTAVNTLDLGGTSETVATLTATGSGTNQVISSASTGSGTTLTTTNAPSTNQGTLTVTTSTNDTFSGSLGGSGSATNFGLVMNGTGTLTLSGTNTYTGPTTVTTGTLLVTGSTVSATNTINGGTLQGNGSVKGIIVNSGGNVTPGAAGFTPQEFLSGTTNNILSATSLALNGGANLTYNLYSGPVSLPVTQPLGGNEINLNGGLLTLGSLGTGTNALTLNFNGTGAYGAGTLGTGQPAIYDLITDFSSSVITASQLNSDLTNGDIVLNDLDGMTSSNAVNWADFVIIGSGSDLTLQLDVVPEPGTWAMFALGLGLLLVYQRKRRRHD
ncbi:MAG: autotransporter-associated beta strand repeat-containing protein [Methylacidiphilales bacterium]|nr:autotransporter-associated beta strand repeat-containing protein [Candidatus Methylacidiphilales bacterium]